MLRLLATVLLALAAPAAAQARFEPFGTGCPNGVGTAALSATGRPVAGQLFQVFAEPVPNGVGALALGSSRTADPHGRLPRLLHPTTPGCVQWVAFDVLEPATPFFGRAAWLTRVPGDPTLVGAELFCQHLHTAPGANRLGIAVSDAARLVVGTPPDRVVVATWNIHHGEGLDARIDLPRIAAVLRAAGADVVGLQEVDRNVGRSGVVDQTAELARLLGFAHRAFGRSIPLGGGEYGNALVSRWPIASVAIHPLPNPASREARTVLDARITLPAGRTLRAMVTHFDHGGDPTTRNLSADAVLGLLGSSSEPTVLIGDLNDTPGSETLRRLEARFADASARNPLPTYRADLPTRRIDWVMMTPAGPFEVLSSDVPVEPVASDHRPVVVQIDVY